MRHLSILLLFLSPFVVLSQSRPMTTDDGLDVINLSSAMISPDGARIVYGKSVLNWEKNKRDTKYHRVDADGANDYQYLGETSSSSLQFSPDGTYVSLKRKVKDYQQLFLMRTAGGEAIQATKHTNSIGPYSWSKDANNIYFVSSETQSKADKKKKKDGYDHVFIDEGPNGQREASWNYLYVYNLEKDTIVQLTKENQRIQSWDVSPDQSRILFTARKENRRNLGNLSEIYLFTVADSSTTRLTDNQAPESSLSWAPNGKDFIYQAADDQNWELRNAKIWMMNADTKANRMISGAFEGRLRSNVHWSTDGGTLYFSGQFKTVVSLYSLEVASGALQNLSNNETGNYTLRGMDKEKKTALLSYQDHATPNDLYVTAMDSFDPKRITDLNKGFKAKYDLSTASPIQWKSSDGLEIEGLLYLPPNYDKKKKYPLLLHIHGGPAGSFSDAYRPQYHVWAGLGYVQLCPNVRGSSGYTDELLRGNMKDIGGMDYEDLMTGVDYLIEEKIVDKDKMAVRGWSYGGILGGTTVTKTDRFKAASLGAMVSDWTSEYGIGFNFDVRLWYIGGTPWENPEGYRSMSPLTNASNVTTPVLLLHGANDRTDTEAQSMMFFAALKDMGKTVRYIQFPRELHGFREPRHQRTRDIEEIKWIQQYTLGLDWTPWEQKTEKNSD